MLLSSVLLALTAPVAAQFHGQDSPDADNHAWRKVELWKEHLVDDGNRTRVELLLENKAKIQSRRSQALSEIREEIIAATGKLDMVEHVFRTEYVELRLGYFDLHYPIWYLQDKAKLKELGRLAIALLDLQGKFLEWVGLAPAARASQKDSEPPVQTTLIELREMYADWKPRRLTPTTLDEARSRFEGLNETAQAQVFASYMRQQLWMDEEKRLQPLTAGENPLQGLHVFMAADWQNYLGVACGFSLMDEVEEVKEDGQRLADFVWYDDLPTWTYFYWWEKWGEETLQIQVMASEYATTDEGKVWALDTPGSKMDAVTVNKTGLEQHLVQHISERFFQMNFNARLHLAVQNGFATELVFELYDENNEKSSGSGVANRTEAYEVFIPGAPSAGGILPAISAENRVRRGWKAKKGQGGDRFAYFLGHQLKPGLKIAKKRFGKKRLKDYPYYFPIFPTDDNLDKRVVYPPLFSLPEMPLPEFFRGVEYSQYAPDHRAFFRAYKVYFACWLRTQAIVPDRGGAKEAVARSEAAFSQLLLLAARKAKKAGPVYQGDTIGCAPFLEAISEVYGMPLTSADLTDPAHPSLEALCLLTLD